MLNKDSVKYSYNDIAVMPADISEINHRRETNPFYDNGKLPIFTAPMSSIVNVDNISEYINNHINVVLPRNLDIVDRFYYMSKYNCFAAVSMNEAEKCCFGTEKVFLKNEKINLCIDVANGHMRSLYDLVKRLKSEYTNITIMTGNIANPETIKYACEAGVDYIRIGIGTGAGCITSSNTSIHYPIASLIDECVKKRHKFGGKVKIIADGGIRNYNDVIKALALGADYVMIGGLFATCLEAGPVYQWFTNTLTNEPCSSESTDFHNLDLFHKFYGMASKEGMRDLGLKKHTAEGISKFVKITQTIEGWANNMEDYLRSAMSYTGTTDIKYFKYNATAILISGNTYQSVNK